MPRLTGHWPAYTYDNLLYTRSNLPDLHHNHLLDVWHVMHEQRLPRYHELVLFMHPASSP